jgi:glycosyltransferase involved in cell wall biosynthesis
VTGPEITVVVPTYNGAAWIGETLASIRQADGGERVELIVVDDGSTDGTIERVADVGLDATVVHMAANIGEAAARNRGLAESAGRMVTFVDQDDVICRDHFTELTSTMTALDADACAPRSISFGERASSPDVDVDLATDVAPHDSTIDALERHRHRREPFVVTPRAAMDGGVSNTVFARREVLIAAGGFSPLLRGTGDYLLLYELARVARLAKSGVPTYGYRVHPAMSTHTYDMTRNVMLCRAMLSAASNDGNLASAWDVQLLSDMVRRAPDWRSQLGRSADAAALARLVRARPRQWAGIVRRVVRPQ